MKIQISQKDDHYLCNVSEEEYIFGPTLEKTETHESHLLSTTLATPLIVVYTVLQRQYPAARIEISALISPSPWIRSELGFALTPRTAERVSRMLEMPTKQCGRCKRPAYWQYSVQAYHCNTCDAVEMTEGWQKQSKSFWRSHIVV